MTTARRNAAGTTGVRGPTSKGSDLPRVMTLLTEASQAHRRAVSGEIGPASSNSQRAPDRALQRLQVHGDRDVGALPGHLGPIRPVQPLPTDIAESVGSALR